MAASSSFSASGHREEEFCSDDVEPWIFLSHSGQEKGFVERLDESLRGANHSPFFDVKSLEAGERFHDPILQAAAGCKLGVVVLSQGFMSTKWPMMELDTMVRASVPVFPVFFRLSPEDLKSPHNLSAWGKAWEDIATKGVETSHWEALAKDHISPVIGPVYRGGSELAFIREIVRGICTRLPPPFPYDVSLIHGSQRLTQVVNAMFEDAHGSVCPSISKEACVIGLHAVGGYGKTTMCKLMVNHHNTMYLGKSILLEFPSDGPKVHEEITEACKKALRRLLRISDEQLSMIYHFEQVLAVMRTHMKRFDVFIAIDNISRESSREARKILRVGYSPNSRILMTSRSDAVLREVMSGCGDICVASLPVIQEEEAIHTFQDACGHHHTSPELLDRVVKLCRFDGCYHPLALQALGLTLKRRGGDLALQIDDLEQDLGSQLSAIQKLIRSNYESISDVTRQHMFLDVAVLYDSGHVYYDVPCDSLEDVCRWLCFIYEKRRLGKSAIKDCLMDLAYGLLQLEGVGERTKVKMHDLYRELGRSKAAASGQYLVHGWHADIRPTEELQESRQWEGLKTIMVSAGASSLRKVVEALQQQRHTAWSKLEVLLQRHTAWSKLEVLVLTLWNGALDFMKSMPCLRVLMLLGDKSRGSDATLDLESMPRLNALVLKDLRLRKVTSWGGSASSELRWLEIENCEWEQLFAMEHIQNLRNLHTLRMISRCHTISKRKNSRCLRIEACLQNTLRIVSRCHTSQRHRDTAKNSRCLRIEGCLQNLRIEGSDCWKYKFQQLDLSANSTSSLQLLDLQGVESLEEIMGLSSATNIRVLGLHNCPRLHKLSNLSGCARLEEIVVNGCESLKEIEGIGTVQHLEIRWCRSLKRFAPQHVQRLTLDDNSLDLLEGVGTNFLLFQLTLYVHLETLQKSLQNLCHNDIASSLKALHLKISSTRTGSQQADAPTGESIVSLDLSDCAQFSQLQRLQVRVAAPNARVLLGVKLEYLDLTTLSHLTRLKISGNCLKEVAGFLLPSSLQSLDLLKCAYRNRPSTIVDVPPHPPHSCISEEEEIDVEDMNQWTDISKHPKRALFGALFNTSNPPMGKCKDINLPLHYD